MGKEAEHIFKAFTFEEGGQKKYDVVLKKFEEHFVQPSNAILSSPGGKLNCKGRFTANIALKENTYSEDIYIIEGPSVNNLLSRQAACRMGLVQRVNETTADVYGDI